MIPKKKVPRRWLAAFKCGHRIPIRPYVDEEQSIQMLKRVEASNYTDKEAIEVLDYLAKFYGEYCRNSYLNAPDALHKTKKQKLEVMSTYNQRYRDIQTIEKIQIISTDPKDIQAIKPGAKSVKKDIDVAMVSTEARRRVKKSDQNTELSSDAFMNTNRNLHDAEDTFLELLDHKLAYDAASPEEQVRIDEHGFYPDPDADDER